MSTLPQRWSPQAVIIDGMLLINCKPHSGTLPLLRSMQLLFNRFISPQYQAGAIEVHLVFDTPSKHPFSPKCYERKRRDQSHPSTNHNHLSFTPSTKVPQSWSSYIEYRQCKHALIETIGLAYLRSARFRLQQQKHFNIAGCMSDQTGDVAWVMSGSEISIKSRGSRHENLENATQTSAHERILVYFPDTDVYNIGLYTNYSRMVVDRMHCTTQCSPLSGA